ncbi:hypothetical protein CAPTEDRAFT_143019 [Capitella teleta]|uniref:G-protein coupled receptors family 2 profile 2 domain-containing protein n=1 Tax=Capitella teleta TaxID=283909 RepID=R7TYL3_CAPTE|nr:hypothetical protein CAPTEDRAFT_143019 [Capitella teleta]|eukprot:ELT96521.1 hypothetical protein CAPTEDRAFT_143019 [Capitella teleta]
MSWESILSLVCAALSLVSLLSTLCVHCMFPSLLKGGEKPFVNLVVSLLVGEISIFSSAFDIGNGFQCSLLAAFQHFAWLASFSWTAIFSWDIFDTFVRENTVPGRGKLWTGYVIEWGLPALTVAICDILHYFHLFQYDGEYGCWISDPLQLGLSFGLPVAGIVLFNIILYSIVVSKISRTMWMSQNAGQTYSNRQRFILYSKLSSIVGFTCIFGFLANVEVLSFLRYAFMVSAGLCFVCFSFTVSRKTIDVIKSRLSTVT